MDNTLENNLTDLANELKIFNRNDVLVNIQSSPILEMESIGKLIILEPNLERNKIYRSALQQFKESGAHVFCLSAGVLEWEWKGKICESPILLCPAQFKFHKVKQEYHIMFDESEAFLNPFLEVEFDNLFDFKWPKVNFLEPKWDPVFSELHSAGFHVSIKNEFHYGNFHHHRYTILRDVEFLEKCNHFSPPLNELLQIHTDAKIETLTLSNRLLFPSDLDQNEVFTNVGDSNLVIQGPPGTGKSQVLTNFIGKNLFEQHATLVVSEKRVALEVLQKKLSTHRLDKFCFLPSAENPSQTLLDQLKKTWLYLESYTTKQPFQLNLSQQKIDALQFKLDLVSKKDIIGGVGFKIFQEMAKKYDLHNARYNSHSALLSNYVPFKSDIRALYQTQLCAFLRYIPFRMLVEDFTKNLDQNLKAIEKKYALLSKKFPLKTYDDLFALMKKASFAQLLSNEYRKAYFGILKPNSTERKKFNRLSKKYFTLKKEMEILSEEKKNWKILPTKSETVALLEAHNKGSLLKKIVLSRRMNQLRASSFVPSQPALENWLKFLETKEEFQTIEKQLAEIGITEATELDWIKIITQQINEESWLEYTRASSKENKMLADSNLEINSFYHDVKTYLKLEELDTFETVFSLADQHLPTLVSKREWLKSLSEKLYVQLGKNPSLEELEQEILKSSWIHFIGQFPAFEKFSWSNLAGELDEIIDLQQEESEDFSIEITLQIKADFDRLFGILNTSSRKLSEEEKIRKRRLKKGRAILVKEFAKTRNHPSVRELLSSESEEWIRTLLPVWMANPSQVSDFFPQKKEQFEYVLFDEATQIPLVHSLGALFRAKRAIVVGDEQQMTPTQFFRTGESEPLDLLHQARFTWKKIMLKHHYRSQNPKLIAFSNRHFYNNELIAYPSAYHDKEAVQLHFIADGKFIDRENTIEAKTVALSLENLLHEKETLGIVAFSEKQLTCIYKNLSPKARQILEERIEKNTCFFRALENIQGEECDHLLISLGYGRNEEEKVLLNFGPVIRKSGRRRLNVLLSRAKMKIDFYTSIQSSDLILSANDSLNLLRQFLQSVENDKQDNQITFPLQLDASILESKQKGKKLAIINNVVDQISQANELITLHRVLIDRNWEVQYS